MTMVAVKCTGLGEKWARMFRNGYSKIPQAPKCPRMPSKLGEPDHPSRYRPTVDSIVPTKIQPVRKSHSKFLMCNFT